LDNIENIETIKQLSQLAMEAEMNIPIDWENFVAPKEQIFNSMAAQVLQQMENTPEDQRAVVAMATITKLLVENFALVLLIKGNNENG
jgi:hypothetical protein